MTMYTEVLITNSGGGARNLRRTLALHPSRSLVGDGLPPRLHASFLRVHKRLVSEQ